MGVNRQEIVTQSSAIAAAIAVVTAKTDQGKLNSQQALVKLAALWEIGSQLPKVRPVEPAQGCARKAAHNRIWTKVLFRIMDLEGELNPLNRHWVSKFTGQPEQGPREYSYGREIMLASEENNGPDGLTVRESKDIVDRPLPLDVSKKAQDQARKALHSYRAEAGGEGLYDPSVFCSGPVLAEWTEPVFNEDGYEVGEREVRAGYQGNDGRPRCPECDTQLDTAGECPDCGYSSKWTGEEKAWKDEQKEMDTLERKIAQEYNREFKAERRDRVSRQRLWIARANRSVLKSARAKWYDKIVKNRRWAASTGLWYRSYLTRDEVDGLWQCFAHRLRAEAATPQGESLEEYLKADALRWT